MEADLRAALLALAPGRVFPDVAPGGTTTPYLTYQQVGGDAPVYVDDVVPDKRNARMQINVWAATRLQAVSVGLSVETALVTAAQFQAQPIGALVALYEPDTGLYGTRQDFSIWSGR